MVELVIENKKYVSTRLAAVLLKCTNDYAGKLAREGKITAIRHNNFWFIEEASIQDYLRESALQKSIQRKELSKQREIEYRNRNASLKLPEKNLTQDVTPTPSLFSVKQALMVAACFVVLVATKFLAGNAAFAHVDAFDFAQHIGRNVAANTEQIVSDAGDAVIGFGTATLKPVHMIARDVRYMGENYVAGIYTAGRSLYTAGEKINYVVAKIDQGISHNTASAVASLDFAEKRIALTYQNALAGISQAFRNVYDTTVNSVYAVGQSVIDAGKIYSKGIHVVADTITGIVGDEYYADQLAVQAPTITRAPQDNGDAIESELKRQDQDEDDDRDAVAINNNSVIVQGISELYLERRLAIFRDSLDLQSNVTVVNKTVEGSRISSDRIYDDISDSSNEAAEDAVTGGNLSFSGINGTFTGNVSVTGTTTLSGPLVVGGSSGIAGYVLQSTGTGAVWVATSTLGISSGGGTWGSITGTLADQTDLQAALDAKLSTTTAASTYVAQALTLNTLALTGDQTFATGTAGTDFGISSSGSIHTFNIPDAGEAARGLVTTSTQTFAGAKTFSNDLALSGTSANILLGSNWLSGDGGDEGVYVNSSGNVGINTSSPAQKLHVSGSGSTYMMIENTSTSGFAGVFGKNDTGKTAEFGVVASGQATYRILRANEAYLYTASEAFNFTIDNAAGTFRWGIGPTTVAKMVLNSSGNLGIGTTTPATPLHVYNATNGGTVATIQNTFADLTVDTSLLDLKFTDPTDTEAYFLRGVDASNTVRWSFTRDGLVMGTGQSVQAPTVSGASSNLLLMGRGSSNTDVDVVTIQPVATMTNTSGTRATLEILPSYNQTSGTAANNDLLINRTETAVGSGAQYLINAGVSGGSFVSKFNVSNVGAGYFADNISAANFSGSSSGTNTGDQVADGLTITGAGTVGDPFVAVGGGGGGTWGSITGTLSDQTDLQNALNDKYDAADFGTDFESQFSWKNSDNLTEGLTNLYFSDARAITALTGQNISLFTNDAGFITNAGETDQVYTASSWNATTNNSPDWDTAFGWGDHGVAGYAKLDGSNQPFTGNLEISKSEPRITLSDTGDSAAFLIDKLSANNKLRLVSQNRAFLAAGAVTTSSTNHGAPFSHTLSNFSVSFWLKTTDSGQNMFAGNTSNNTTFFIDYESGNFYLRVNGSTVSWPYSAATFANNTWHHIVFAIAKNGSSQVYVDGVSLGNVTAPNADAVFTHILRGALSSNLRGTIDEFIIFDSQIDSTKVAELYQSGTPYKITDYTGVYAAFHFDTGSGTTYVDSSGNGRNATAVSAPTWTTGVVSAGVEPTSDVEFLALFNNSIANSYGTTQLGYMNSTLGTTNIYEGLTHRFNILGTQVLGLSSAAVSVTGTLTATSDITTSAGRVFSGSLGTALLPAFSLATDTNTGAWFPAADTYAISTGGTERMRVTSGGLVGIGLTPTARLHISDSGTASTAASELLSVQATYGSNSAKKSITWRDGTNITGQIATSYNGSMIDMTFGSFYNSGYNSTDRVIFKGSGQVGIGTGSTVSAQLHAISTTEQLRLGYDASNYLSTTVGSTGAVTLNAVGSGQTFNFSDYVGIGGTPSFPLDVTSTVSSAQTYGYLNSSGSVGTSSGTTDYSIRAVGRILAPEFNAVSDGRLKNINFDLDSYLALDLIAQMKPVSFNWLAEPDGKPVLGFIAQDVQGIIPNAVSYIDGGIVENQLTLDYNQLTTVSIGAIKAIRESLGDSIDNLEYESIFATETESVGIVDLITYINEQITSKTKTLSDFVALRITAMRAYVGDLFADKVTTNKLCIPDSNGVEVCLTGDQLRELLGEEASDNDEFEEDDTTDNGTEGDNGGAETPDENSDETTTDTEGEGDIVDDATDDTSTDNEPVDDTPVTDEGNTISDESDVEGDAPADPGVDSGSETGDTTDSGASTDTSDSGASDAGDSGSGAGSDSGSDAGGDSDGASSGGDSGAAATE